jgi:hypothetical protein
MTQHSDDYSWLYIGLSALIGSAILYFLFLSPSSGDVKVRYRDDKVDISASNFDPLNKSDSTVKGAWYDNGNEYMVIKLGGAYYHYCGMSSSTWSEFKTTSFPYIFYQDNVKGDFDCRVNPVPRYQ